MPEAFGARAWWQARADRLLESVARFRSPAGAAYHLPGPASASGKRSDGLEGYARSFWLAACRAVHAEPDRREELVVRYRDGLLAGTDPGHPERWPRRAEAVQVMVECGSLAVGLHLTRPWLWDSLDDATRARVEGYLLDGVDLPEATGNWVLFRVLAHAFLRSVGVPVAVDRTLADLDHVDGLYRGEGWYTDGGGPGSARYDYYNSWSMATYPVLWAGIEGEALDPDRAAAYRDRAARHAASLLHLVGGDGAPVHQGRSLPYRAGLTAALWTAQFAGPGRVPAGAARRAASLVLEHFERRGMSAEGLPTLGWYGEHLPATQTYSGPASPLWMSKAFLGLVLPPTDPAWTEPLAPIPVERGDFVRVEAVPGRLVSGTRSDGVIRVANLGTSRDREERDPHSAMLREDAWYARYGYSTRTGPVTAGALTPTAVATIGGPRRPDGACWPVGDNDVLLLAGGLPSVRDGVRVLAAGPDWIEGVSVVSWPAATGGPDAPAVPGTVRIRVLVLAHGPQEVRVISWDDAGPADEVLWTGWAPAGDHSRGPGAIGSRTGRGWAEARAGGLVSRLRVHDAGAEGAVVAGGPNAFGTATGIPTVRTRPDGGPWVAVLGLGERLPPDPQVETGARGETIVTWADGHVSTGRPSH